MRIYHKYTISCCWFSIVFAFALCTTGMRTIAAIKRPWSECETMQLSKRKNAQAKRVVAQFVFQ